jgi:beta-galactosidase
VPDPAPGPRIVAPLNRDWWYTGPLPSDGTAPAPDDLAGFERVTLPHANVRLPWHGFDEVAFQFVSEYRRQITLPESLRGRRVILDFDGVMTAHTVSLNGAQIGDEYRGGYLPSSFEITDHLRWGQPNDIVVRVDSTERADIPPFGGRIDYLTFGGIYREARLRIVPPTFIDNVFAKPVDVLTDRRRVEVRIDLAVGDDPPTHLRLHGEIVGPDGTVVGKAEREIEVDERDAHRPGITYGLTMADLGEIELWDLDRPSLYRVILTLERGEGDAAEVLDRYEVRFGFREARFTPEGFFLNGRRVKLRGLNRHQTYPYVGGAMPARVQRKDALILKHEI